MNFLVEENEERIENATALDVDRLLHLSHDATLQFYGDDGRIWAHNGYHGRDREGRKDISDQLRYMDKARERDNELPAWDIIIEGSESRIPLNDSSQYQVEAVSHYEEGDAEIIREIYGNQSLNNYPTEDGELMMPSEALSQNVKTHLDLDIHRTSFQDIMRKIE